jgi:hypothetical protein
MYKGTVPTLSTYGACAGTDNSSLGRAQNSIHHFMRHFFYLFRQCQESFDSLYLLGKALLNRLSRGNDLN